MFIATFGIALSLTITAIYLTFYSMDERTYKQWNKINFMGILTLIYTITFCYVASEFGRTDLYFTAVFITLIVYAVNLLLAQYE
mmetsp:Transcript_13031/g.20222  ORF Transcript_13031/g.20222 Transcript_13031/m.20222 type:complete len:84 (+) Transcript_13031:473-724(+)